MKKNKTKHKKFPHIFRKINAKLNKKFVYSYFLVLVCLGLGALIMINLVFLYQFPTTLKKLLTNPTDSKALTKILKQTTNTDLEKKLNNYLLINKQTKIIEKAEEKKIKSQAEIKRVQEIVKNYPNYPDGWAYLALLYNKTRNCEQAEKSINQAIRLDPNKKKFQELKTVIGKCE